MRTYITKHTQGSILFTIFMVYKDFLMVYSLARNHQTGLMMKSTSVAVFGASQTGKSSLVSRFLGKPFEEQHKPTVEDYHYGKIYSGEGLCHLNITDTSGSFAFPAMDRLAMEKADAFIFVYSIEDTKSFERVKIGLDRLCEVRDIESIPIMVVCNKADLDDIAMLRQLQMRMDKGGLDLGTNGEMLSSFKKDSPSQRQSTLSSQRDLVLALGCKFLLTSAKLRWNVNRIFYQLLAEDEKELEEKKPSFGMSRAANTMKCMWKKVQLGRRQSKNT